jgi:hypothetical protein
MIINDCSYDQCDALGLAQRIDSHELLEFRRVAAWVPLFFFFFFLPRLLFFFFF